MSRFLSVNTRVSICVNQRVRLEHLDMRLTDDRVKCSCLRQNADATQSRSGIFGRSRACRIGGSNEATANLGRPAVCIATHSADSNHPARSFVVFSLAGSLGRHCVRMLPDRYWRPASRHTNHGLRLMRNSNLSGQERDVYSVLLSWIKANLSFPNQKQIASCTDLSANTVRKCLQSLGDKHVIELAPSYVPGSRLCLLSRGKFRMRGKERAVLGVDNYLEYWLGVQTWPRPYLSTTTYLGCWQSHEKAMAGLADLGWRPTVVRDEFGFCVDDEGASIVPADQVLLLVALYRQVEKRVASKEAWYEACHELARQLGWQTRTSGRLRGYSTRLPDGFVEFSDERSRFACRLTDIGVSAVQGFLSGKTLLVTAANMSKEKRDKLRSNLGKLTTESPRTRKSQRK